MASIFFYDFTFKSVFTFICVFLDGYPIKKKKIECCGYQQKFNNQNYTAIKKIQFSLPKGTWADLFPLVGRWAFSRKLSPINFSTSFVT